MTLRVIPTGVHGVLDYLASGINLTFPGLLGMHDAPWAATVPRIDGLAGLVYSLFLEDLWHVRATAGRVVAALRHHIAFDCGSGFEGVAMFL